MRVAVECYADLDLFRFLREDCNLTGLSDAHSHSQGEVINDVFARDRADIGIVDEDPLSTHHRLRDQMVVVETGVDTETREHHGRQLIIVKPDLERCFIRAMGRVGLKSSFGTPSAMHQALASSSTRKHQVFRDELKSLRVACKERGMRSFVVEIEDRLRLEFGKG